MASLHCQLHFTVHQVMSKSPYTIASYTIADIPLPSEPRPDTTYIRAASLQMASSQIGASTRPSLSHTGTSISPTPACSRAAVSPCAHSAPVGSAERLNGSIRDVHQIPAMQARTELSNTTLLSGASCFDRQAPSNSSTTKHFTDNMPGSSSASNILAQQQLTADASTDNDLADITITLSRRKAPQAFISGARLRKMIDLTHFKDKKASGPSLYSVEDLVIIHKAAEAQIRESRNKEIRNHQRTNQVQAENARLRWQSDELERALNQRIADQEELVNERCASREQMINGLVRDNRSEPFQLKQEITRVRATTDGALRKAWQEIVIMQKQ